MNQFLGQDNMEGVKVDPPVQPSKRKRSDEEAAEKKMDLENDNNNTNGKEEEDESDWQTDMQNKLANGPYVYELYSVLIHRGSALGGHYYAYIKSFETNKWYNWLHSFLTPCRYEFNDSSVSEITVDEIQKTFGEEADDKYRRPGMMYFHSSANAYMLMYRRVDSKRNKITVAESVRTKTNYIKLPRKYLINYEPQLKMKSIDESKRLKKKREKEKWLL
jgi:ubiquitin carboxyl-terminal hydrolase 47